MSLQTILVLNEKKKFITKQVKPWNYLWNLGFLDQLLADVTEEGIVGIWPLVYQQDLTFSGKEEGPIKHPSLWNKEWHYLMIRKFYNSIVKRS